MDENYSDELERLSQQYVALLREYERTTEGKRLAELTCELVEAHTLLNVKLVEINGTIVDRLDLVISGAEGDNMETILKILGEGVGEL
jgi:alpha-D-ribose 1-methylphosphonate 5-triphosphate synthase subunit PhnI